MSDDDERPWLALHGHQPADHRINSGDELPKTVTGKILRRELRGGT